MIGYILSTAAGALIGFVSAALCHAANEHSHNGNYYVISEDGSGNGEIKEAESE